MMRILLLLWAGSLLWTSVAGADSDWDRARSAHESGDYAAEVAIVRPLAEQGSAYAQFNLGVLYDNGQGVPQNDALAMQWYQKAAEQGLSQAQVNLAIMYREGQGLPPDPVRAYFWFALAESQGDWQAPRAKTALARQMTPPQVEDAERQVQEWLATHTFSIPPLPEPDPRTLQGNR
jgi:uncharacterized protein